jgi:Phasin protein
MNQSSAGSGAKADQSPDMPLTPAVALSVWGTCLAGAFRVNAQAQAGLGALGSEWQDFAGRQLKENFAFMQRLGRNRTPDEILAAYAQFWQRAADEYGKEVTTLTKLATDVTTKWVAASQSVADDANKLLSSRDTA